MKQKIILGSMIVISLLGWLVWTWANVKHLLSG